MDNRCGKDCPGEWSCPMPKGHDGACDANWQEPKAPPAASEAELWDCLARVERQVKSEVGQLAVHVGPLRDAITELVARRANDSIIAASVRLASATSEPTAVLRGYIDAACDRPLTDDERAALHCAVMELAVTRDDHSRCDAMIIEAGRDLAALRADIFNEQLARKAAEAMLVVERKLASQPPAPDGGPLPSVTEAMVEAGARAFCEATQHVLGPMATPFDELSDDGRESDKRVTRAILTAALAVRPVEPARGTSLPMMCLCGHHRWEHATIGCRFGANECVCPVFRPTDAPPADGTPEEVERVALAIGKRRNQPTDENHMPTNRADARAAIRALRGGK